MSLKSLEFSIENSVARIILNRPDIGNPMNGDSVSELEHVAHLCDNVAVTIKMIAATGVT